MMSSVTGDFSEVTKSALSTEYQRGSQSCVKKRPRASRGLINLPRLNLEEIKKEVEDAARFSDTFSSYIDTKNEETVTCAYPKSDNYQNNCAKSDKNQEDISTPMKTTVVPNTKKNDSFDLDFSALSLVTPSKKLDCTYITPQVRTVSACSGRKVIKFDDFRTPQVNNIPARNAQSASKATLSSVQKNLPLFSKIEETEEKSPEQTTATQISVLRDLFPFDVMRINCVEYIILNTLGKGGSSEVFAGFCPVDKRHVAIKCVSLQNPLSAEGYINEVKLLQKLQDCDKIIKMYDYEILGPEKKLLVVLERGGEDLAAIMKKLATQQSHVPPYKLVFFWMEMLHAVQQIHSHGVIHSDLKPSNFLRDMGGLKLIDFGISSSVQTDMTSVLKTAPEGSCNYISPEALNQDSSNPSSPDYGVGKYKVHFKSDVWSLGCILYQLVYKRTPFDHLRNMWKKLGYITNPDHIIEYPAADWVPPKIINTMKSCLRYSVRSRPSVDELIKEYDSLWSGNS